MKNKNVLVRYVEYGIIGLRSIGGEVRIREERGIKGNSAVEKRREENKAKQNKPKENKTKQNRTKQCEKTEHGVK